MSDQSGKPSLTYRDAGVNIDAGNALVERIKAVSRRTARPEVLGGLGGFGALCEIPAGYREPVLVSPSHCFSWTITQQARSTWRPRRRW